MTRDALPVSTDGRDALAVADAVAREAGALILEASRGVRAMEHKGRNNVVTATDRASEALIIQRIEAAFPDHLVLSEETRPDTNWRHGYVGLWTRWTARGTSRPASRSTA